MRFEGDPDHPILEWPFKYEIAGLSYHRDFDRWENSYTDLTLRKGASVRRLRFYGPQDLRIDEGLPNSSGLRILDVSGRGLEGLTVRVANFEPVGGCPTFWARNVVDLDRVPDHS